MNVLPVREHCLTSKCVASSLKFEQFFKLPPMTTPHQFSLQIALHASLSAIRNCTTAKMRLSFPASFLLIVFACDKSIEAFAPFGAASMRQHGVLHQSTRSENDFQESLATNGEAYDNTYEPTLQGDGSQRPDWLVSSSSAPDPNKPAAFVPPKQAAPIAKSEGDKVQEVQSHVSLMRERYAAAARNKKRTAPRTTPVATTATPTMPTTPISPGRNIKSQTSSGVSQHYTSAAADATREYSAGKTEPTSLGSSISLTSFIPGSPLELKHRQVTALRERNRLVQERKRLNKGLPPRPKLVSITPPMASRQPSIAQTKAASPQSSSSVNGYVDPRLGKSHSRVAMLRERARQAQEQRRRQQNGQ
jgi:hypothetical protein